MKLEITSFFENLEEEKIADLFNSDYPWDALKKLKDLKKILG